MNPRTTPADLARVADGLAAIGRPLEDRLCATMDAMPGRLP